MIRGFLDNLGSALLALLLAVMVWVVAITDGNPVQAKAFPSEGVPIQVLNVPDGFVLYESIVQRAMIILRAPSTTWDTLNAGDLVVFVDLAKTEPGIHDVPVQVRCARCPQERASIVRIDPARITVRLEELLEQRLQVLVDVKDRPPQGYTIETTSSNPEYVKVTGPRSQVEQVARVVAPFLTKGAKAEMVQPITVLPIDGQGRTVSNVEISPSTVDVRVVIGELLGYKEVSVRPNIQGSPAPGYYMSNISVSPSTLTVFGMPATSDKAPGVLETEPIDVAGAKVTVLRRVAVIVPDGVTVLGGDPNVLVRVEISAQQGGGSLVIEPTIRGLDAGLTASVSPKTVQVILSGPLPLLQGLKPSDVPVLVDLSGRGPGTYKLAPAVEAPESFKVVSLVPDTVEVVLAVAPTATPSPTPSPTPKKR
ncbi:MAG: hypothetical protein A2Z04_05950 [Chloroflexi bacterium RBG_16_57_9]|nr:MAG: hypothetical protein A2Z04_05950 [Chloroflexi bacterium RBG_16_57_9]